MTEHAVKNIMVTGGGGYVGSELVPQLLRDGHRVRVLDLFIYGEEVLEKHPSLELVKGDIRDEKAVRKATAGCDSIIHLACISNDPSFELNPDLGRSINLSAFPGLVRIAQEEGVQRFIYASSSSVYGVREEPDVREDSPCNPLTDYSRFKLECEHILRDMVKPGGMTAAILRPATVCGYAPRLRLDLTVNILTILALVNRKIRIFGGKQLRPNIHVKDMARAYQLFLSAPAEAIHLIPFNVGFENHAVEDIAKLVKKVVGDDGIELCYESSDDIRSYHVNSDRVRQVLGFQPRYTIEDAVRSLAEAFRKGQLTNPLTNPAYYNIKRMQAINMN